MSQLSDEIKVISKSAKVLAVLALVAVPVASICYFFLNARSGDFSSGKFPFGLVIAAIASVFFSVYILILGYIYGDARRRGMRPVFARSRIQKCM